MMIHTSFSKLLNIFFPAKCCACLVFQDEMDLCQACKHQLTPRIGSKCMVCDLLFTAESAPHRCGKCLQAPPKFERCWGVFDDSGPAGRIIRHGKFGQWPEAVDVLAKTFAAHIPDEILNDLPDIIVPIPTHRAHMNARGFSTPSVLAQRVGRRLKRDVAFRAMTRPEQNKSQAGLTLRERKSNVRGAFLCRRMDGLDVLLIDDIYTTGSTVNEATRTLVHSGSSRVRVLCAAYVEENREKISEEF